MKTEIKITDHLKREHLVSFNFTVRTNGFQSWKIYADVRCNGERISFEYLEGKETIEMLMSSNHKADFLATNLRVKEHQLIYSWLSDFPRWHVIDAISKEVLTEERTYSQAEDMAESFYFVENVKIVDTWGI
jgi:hypothetical protein